MEKLREIIEEKYYWRPEYRLILNWADVALEAGVDTIDVITFVTARLFQKAA